MPIMDPNLTIILYYKDYTSWVLLQDICSCRDARSMNLQLRLVKHILR